MLDVKRNPIEKLNAMLDFIEDLEFASARYHINDRLHVEVRVGDVHYLSADFQPFLRLPSEPVYAAIKAAYGKINQ